MKNLDMPAEPLPAKPNGSPWTVSEMDDGYVEQCRPAFGFTKRERACIDLGVPSSGDPELDALIEKGNEIQKAMIDAPVVKNDDWPDLSTINLE